MNLNQEGVMAIGYYDIIKSRKRKRIQAEKLELFVVRKIRESRQEIIDKSILMTCVKCFNSRKFYENEVKACPAYFPNSRGNVSADDYIYYPYSLHGFWDERNCEVEGEDYYWICIGDEIQDFFDRRNTEIILNAKKDRKEINGLINQLKGALKNGKQHNQVNQKNTGKCLG
jgi:hypothetical protein